MFVSTHILSSLIYNTHQMFILGANLIDFLKTYDL